MSSSIKDGINEIESLSDEIINTQKRLFTRWVKLQKQEAKRQEIM